jgi:hypothetical protein
MLLLGCASSPSPAPAAPQSASPTEPAVAEKPDLLRVHEPQSGAVVTSPLVVRGEARGTWYFEANFPVRLLDTDGNTLAQGYAQAAGEWMTESFVPFSAELKFEPAASTEGVLVLDKANASGLPEHADSLRVPVRFR